MKETYEEQTDIRYGAARGWLDAIIQPHETRDVLVRLLGYVSRPMPQARFHMGVVQLKGTRGLLVRADLRYLPVRPKPNSRRFVRSVRTTSRDHSATGEDTPRCASA